MNLFKREFLPLLKLAIPLACIGMLQSSVYFLQTSFLGHLNHEALAAGALVIWLFGTINAITLGTAKKEHADLIS